MACFCTLVGTIRADVPLRLGYGGCRPPIYDAAKRLGGPDLISAVVTQQQPLLWVCVRGEYSRISVSACENALISRAAGGSW